MRRAGITACAPLLAVFALTGAALPASAAAMTCRYLEQGAPGPSGNELVVNLGREEGAVALEPVDGRIRVASTGEDEPERLIGCIGGEPTTTNIDLATIRTAGQEFGTGLTLNLEDGALAPGATPEADGGSEIEVRVVQVGRARRLKGRRHDSFSDPALNLFGTPGPDRYSATATKKHLGVNLNAGTDFDADVTMGRISFSSIQAGAGDDVITTSLVKGSTVIIDGEAGDDTITAASGPGRFFGGDGADVLTGGPGRDSLLGEEGNDVLLGKGGHDIILAGSGQDLVMAGGGPDRVVSDDDKEPDTVSCGGGLDTFSADSTDKVSGCERRPPRRRFEQPRPVR